jgi:hypothetical protein
VCPSALTHSQEHELVSLRRSVSPGFDDGDYSDGVQGRSSSRSTPAAGTMRQEHGLEAWPAAVGITNNHPDQVR